ncbi:MAG: M20 family metallopeptidase [Variibacter sp.]|nr:M20 family metallopeptidase [Variibacter sp.]
MLTLLQTLVNIDGGSYDKAGVDAVGDRLREFLEAQGLACETFRNERFGDALRATLGVAGAGANSTIVLMGHRDTVFPKGEPTRRPFRIENGRAYGPGVCDMKAGLVMNAFVLAAFARMGGAPAPLVGLFTSDEEIGSPACRPLIEAEARRARAVFNSEPGRVGNQVVTGRKGGVFMRLAITGKAAHSGANFEAGISAIEELARKIVALHALTDLKRGITVNVGTVTGGQTVNTVAPSAACEIDLRFVTPADREDAMRAIRAIVETSHLAGTSAQLEISGEFLPLVESPHSQALYAHYAACAETVGDPVKSAFTGGCADSGFAAATGAPTICAVGPVGGNAHSPEEFLEVDSMVPRAQNLALAILRLGA